MLYILKSYFTWWNRGNIAKSFIVYYLCKTILLHLHYPMEKQSTFFVAKNKQPTAPGQQIDLSWSYLIKWKTFIGSNWIKILYQNYSKKELIETRRAKIFLMLLEPTKRFISSVYPEAWYYAFDFCDIYYKLHIDNETNTVKIEKYKLSLL